MDGSNVVAAELRSQMNELKLLIDELTARVDAQDAINTDLLSQINQRITEDQLNILMIDYVANNSSAKTNAVGFEETAFQEPPIFDDLDAVRNKLNELIGGLRR